MIIGRLWKPLDSNIHTWMRQGLWKSVLNPLQGSLHANQMVCAMSSQLFHMEETKDLKGNKEMHEHLVYSSYHRVTAIGSALRLQAGEAHASIVETLTACIQNAEQADSKVNEYLKVMLHAAPQGYKWFIQNIIGWQNASYPYLQRARTELNKAGVLPEGQHSSYSGYTRPHWPADHPAYALFHQVQPVIQHVLGEMPHTSPEHAVTQGVYISYLMGRGYDYPSALRIVESWEIYETLPGQPYIP
jgi:hypothetical protein